MSSPKPDSTPTTLPIQSSEPSQPQTKELLNYKLTKKSALGMFFVAIGSIFGSLMSAAVNYAGSFKVPAPCITFVRCIINLCINLLLCAICKVNPIGPYKEGKKYVWIILRGLFGGVQIVCYFFSFTVIPVGDATTLTFIAPVLTGLFAICMLKEKWGWRDACATLLCFIGVLFVAKPPPFFSDAEGGIDLFYLGIAFLGSCAASIAYIAVRKVGPTVSVFVLINYVLIFTMLITIFQAYLKLKRFPWPGNNVSGFVWFIIVLTGFLGAGAQFCVNRGLQLEKAGPATSMRFLDIVFSYVWQIWMLGDPVDTFSVIGAVLVSLCLILIGFNKWWDVRKARLEYESNLEKKQDSV